MYISVLIWRFGVDGWMGGKDIIGICFDATNQTVTFDV